MSLKPRGLVPLGVPSGWIVVFNIFVAFGEDEVLTAAERSAYLSQDILSMENTRSNGTDGWERYEDNWIIDLGWYGDADPNGNYRLNVLRGGWDAPKAELESRSCWTIQKGINTALRMIANGTRIDDIARQLDLDYPGSARVTQD